MRIAIIGSGISGLSAAYLLHKQHEITIYEKENRLGGHARTREVNGTAVDTGFIVFNDRNYPNLLGLFAELGVESIPSNMSFAASVDGGAFEYSSKSLRGVFYNSKQLLDKRRWAMGRDYFRFSRYAKNFLKDPDDRTLGQLVRDSGVGDHFAQYFILPIGGAIWSCPVSTMMDYPARTFVQFFENHGLLDVNGQPQWRTVKGGSRQYIEKLAAAASNVKLKLKCGPISITRVGEGITIKEKHGVYERYDHVIMAAHADESLALLANPSVQEREVLGAFKFQPNMAYLHGDLSLMPREKHCWASWVYLCDGTKDDAPHLAVSYWMNLLQSLDDKQTLIVTLNPATPPKAELTYDQHLFHHPIFDEAAIQAQEKIPSINGTDRISYVGAWQRYGFHEDGIWSAVRVAKQLGATIPWEKPSTNWRASPHLMRADVMHKRLLPREHAFNYRVYYMALPIEQLQNAAQGIFSVDRFNLLSYYQRDHGARDGTDAAAWARGLLTKFGHADDITNLVLIALPRIAGYVFNPVSFWLGFNEAGELRAAIAEVNNTFKETHSYVLAKSDGSNIGSDDWIVTSKDFHVSPFLPVEGSYRFRIAPRADKLGIWIDHYNAQGELTLLTSLVGRMEPVTRAALWKAFFAIPLVTVKVIGLIHFEALRLVAKKIKYINKPPQKEHRVTHGHE